jgi:hypothetical protein
MSDHHYEVSLPIELERGDIVFIPSDGLLETPSADRGSLFGVDAPIDIIRVNRSRHAQDIIGILFAAAHFLLLRGRCGHRPPIPDDVATMEAFLKVVDQYELTMIPDDMTAVLIKVE